MPDPDQAHRTGDPRDEELIQAFYVCPADVDSVNFAPIYERWYDKLYSFFRHLRGSWPREDWEDLAQETLVKVFRSKAGHRFDSGRGARFVSWIYDIAQNLAIDQYRRVCARRQDAHVTLAGRLGESLVSEDARSSLDAAEWRADSERFAATCPERERVHFVRCNQWIGDESHRELAASMGVSEPYISKVCGKVAKRWVEFFSEHADSTSSRDGESVETVPGSGRDG